MDAIYIEDDATNRIVMREMLAAAGVGMADAEDARTGLRMIGERSYDFILMDIRMPEINGLTAIRQVRAREVAGEHTPIIVITAELTPGVSQLCRQAGADRCIGKPVSSQHLFDEIGVLLTGRASAVLL